MHNGWTIEAIVTAISVITVWITAVLAALGFYIRALVNKHELKDATRHAQNLARFRWLCVALAKMGYNNGEMPTFDDG